MVTYKQEQARRRGGVRLVPRQPQERRLPLFVHLAAPCRRMGKQPSSRASAQGANAPNAVKTAAGIVVPEEPFSAEEEAPGYDPVAGELVLRRTWGNLAVLTEELPFMDDAVPIGYAESGLEVLLEQTEDFSGVLELLPQE